jgi:hypothetical protein
LTEKSERLKLGWDFEILTWYQRKVEERQKFQQTENWDSSHFKRKSLGERPRRGYLVRCQDQETLGEMPREGTFGEMPRSDLW